MDAGTAILANSSCSATEITLRSVAIALFSLVFYCLLHGEACVCGNEVADESRWF